MWDAAYMKRVTLISFFLLAVKYLEYYSIKKGHKNERTNSFEESQSDALGHYLGECTREQKTLTNFPAGFPLHSSRNGAPKNCPKEVALSANGYMKRDKGKGSKICALEQSNLTLCYNGMTSPGRENCAKPLAPALVGAKNNCACSEEEDFYKSEKEKIELALGRKIINRIIVLFFKLFDECAHVKHKLASVFEVFLTIRGTRRSNFSPPTGNLANSNAYTFISEDKIYNNFLYHSYVLLPNGSLTTDGELFFPFHYTHSDRVKIINNEGITNGGVTQGEWLEEGTYGQDYKSTWDRMRCKIDPLGKGSKDMSPKISGRRLSDKKPLVTEGNEDGDGGERGDDKHKNGNDPKKNPPLQNGCAVHYSTNGEKKKKRTCRLLSPQDMCHIKQDYGTELEEKRKKKECINCRILAEGTSKPEDKDKGGENKEEEKKEEEKKEEENKQNEQNQQIEDKHYKRAMCRILQENNGEKNRLMNNTDGIILSEDLLGQKYGTSGEHYRKFRILLEREQTSHSRGMGKGAEGRKNQQVSSTCDRKSRQLAILSEEYFSPDDHSDDINRYEGDAIRKHGGNGSSIRQFRVLADGSDESGPYLEVDGLSGNGENEDDKEDGKGDDQVVPSCKRFRSLSEEGDLSHGKLTIVPGSAGGNGGAGHGQGNNGEKDDRRNSECRRLRLLSEDSFPWSNTNCDSNGSASGGSDGNGRCSNIIRFRILVDDYPDILYDDIHLNGQHIGTGSVGGSGNGSGGNGMGGSGMGGSGNQGENSGGNGNSNGNGSNSRQCRMLAQNGSEPGGTVNNSDGGEGGVNKGNVGSKNQGEKSGGSGNSNGNGSNSRQCRILAQNGSERDNTNYDSDGGEGGVNRGNVGSKNQGENSGGNGNSNGSGSNSRQCRMLAQNGSEPGGTVNNSDGAEGGVNKENVGSKNQGERSRGNGNNNGSGSNSRQCRILAQNGSEPGGTVNNSDGAKGGVNRGNVGSKNQGENSGGNGNSNGSGSNSRQCRMLAQNGSEPGGTVNNSDGAEGGVNKENVGSKNQGERSRGNGNNNGSGSNSRQCRILAQNGSEPGGTVNNSDGAKGGVNRGNVGSKNQGENSGGNGNSNGNGSNSRQCRMLAQNGSEPDGTVNNSDGGEGGVNKGNVGSKNQGEKSGGSGNSNGNGSNSRQCRILAQNGSEGDNTIYDSDGGEGGVNKGNVGSKNQGEKSGGSGNSNGNGSNSRQCRILAQNGSEGDNTNYDSDGGEGGVNKGNVGSKNQGEKSGGSGNSNGNGSNSRQCRILAQNGSERGDTVNNSDGAKGGVNRGNVGSKNQGENSGGNGNSNGNGSNSRQCRMLAQNGSEPDGTVNNSDGGEGGVNKGNVGSKNQGEKSGGSGNSNGNGSNSRQCRILAQNGSEGDNTNYDSDGGEGGVNKGNVGSKNQGEKSGGSGNSNGNGSNSRQCRILAQNGSEGDNTNYDSDGGEGGVNKGNVGSKNQGEKSGGSGNSNGSGSNSRQCRMLAQNGSEPGGTVNNSDGAEGGVNKENVGSKNQGERSRGNGNNNGSGSNSRQCRILAQNGSEPGGTVNNSDGAKGGVNKENVGSKNQGERSRGNGNNNGSGSNSRQCRILAQNGSEPGGTVNNSDGAKGGVNRGNVGSKNQGENSGGNGNSNGSGSNSRQCRMLAQNGSEPGGTVNNSDGAEGGVNKENVGSKNQGERSRGNGNNNGSGSNSRQCRILAQNGSEPGGTVNNSDGAKGGGRGSVIITNNDKEHESKGNGNSNGNNSNGRQSRILAQDGSGPNGTEDGLNGGNEESINIPRGNEGNTSSGSNNKGSGCRGRIIRILAQYVSSRDDKNDESSEGSGSNGIGGSKNSQNATHGKGDDPSSASRQPSPLSGAEQSNDTISGSDESAAGVFSGADRVDQGGEGKGGINTDGRNVVLLSSANLSYTDGMKNGEVEYKEEGKERSSKYMTDNMEGITSGESTKEVDASSETEQIHEDWSSSGKMDMSPAFKKYEMDEEDEEDDDYDDDEEEEFEDEVHKSKHSSYNVNGKTKSEKKVPDDNIGSAPDRKKIKLKRLIKGNSDEWGDALKLSSLNNYGKYGNYADYPSEAATSKHVNYRHLFSESAYIYRKGNYYFINPSPFSIVKMKKPEGVRSYRGSRDYMNCYATSFSNKHNSSKGSEYSYRNIKQIEEIIPGSLTGFKNDDGYMRLLVPSFIPEDKFLNCIFRSETYNGILDEEGHINHAESYPVKIYLRKNLNKTKGCSFQVNEGNAFYKEYADKESFLSTKIIMNEKNSTNNECVIQAFNEIVGFQCGPPYYRMDKKEMHTVEDYKATSEKNDNNLISQGVPKGNFFITDPPYCFEHVNENQNVMDILPDSFTFPNSNMLTGQIQANHTRYIKVGKFSESRTIGCYCNYYKDNSIMYSGKIIIKVQSRQDAQFSSRGGLQGQSDEKVNFSQGVERKKGFGKEDITLLSEKDNSQRGKNYDSDNGSGSGSSKKGSSSTDYTADKTRRNFISNFNFKRKEGISSILFKRNREVSTVGYDVLHRSGDKFKDKYVEDPPIEDIYADESDSGGNAYTDLDSESDTKKYDDQYSDAHTDAYADRYDDLYREPYDDSYTDAHTDPYSNFEDDINGDFLFDLGDSLINGNVPSKYKPLDRSVDMKDSIMHSGESQTITVINKSKDVKLVLPQLNPKEKKYAREREFTYPKVISLVYEENGNKHENVNKSLKLFKEFFPPMLREPKEVDEKNNMDDEREVYPLEGERDIPEEGKDEMVDEEQDDDDVGEWIKWEDRKDGKVERKEGRDVTDWKDDKDEKDMRDFMYRAFSKMQKNKRNNSIDEEINNSGDDPRGGMENDEGDSLYGEDKHVLMRKRRRDVRDSRSGEQTSQDKGRPRRELKREEQTKRKNSTNGGKQGTNSSVAEGDKYRGEPSGEKKEHLEGVRDEQTAERRSEDKTDHVEEPSKQKEDSKEELGPSEEETGGINGEIGEGEVSNKGDEEKGREDERSEAKNTENNEAQVRRKSNGKRKKKMRKRMREKLHSK
ncbi:6-cysteine protein [Plasmodium knowlesi strain H]|uniref:6-cysteine protein n=1 Tax=Plasmodium knowlesi (strain H) TaxID=5851 RepID=A0A679L1Q7_PLAKH|nr:6-cysteine protein [Plasmodium knowlesi strain H]CAA9986462.1 6-cysteine protein [Plasmodium knowlesi strain H]VVS75936.1 6-cysteine protein [Plasmodium knowlesi strain H]